MKLVWVLYVAHVISLLFGLVGMLVMVPNPQLWANDPAAVQGFAFSMQHLGSLHILFGTAAMLLFGWLTIGRRKTVIFFAAATLISLAFELMGTGFGFPFGPYSYTGGLGYMVLDLVPYTIPLSWFYLGFAAFLVASVIVARRGWTPSGPLSVVLGVWLLTAWDLALDPAMAHENLRLKFWIWHETGPYYGMPIRNFIGWMTTGAIFMTVSRLLWRADAGPVPVAFPLVLYLTNLAWVMILCAGYGFWGPVIAAAALGVAPAILLLRPGFSQSASGGRLSPSASQ